MRLRYLAEIRASNIDKKANPGDVEVRLCNYVDVYRNDAITDGLDFMKATATKTQVTNLSVEAGDIVITKDSESRDDIGVPAFVPNRIGGVVYGYHLAVIRPDRRRVVPRYLYWALRSTTTRHYFKTRANGITRFALGYSDLADTPLAVPDFNTQEMIATLLDARMPPLERLIYTEVNLLNRLDERKRVMVAGSVLRGLRGDRLRQSGVAWMGGIPRHWQVRRIKHMARLASGHTPSRSDPTYWIDPTIPWFQLTDIWRFRDDSVEEIIDTAEMISETGLRHSSAELLPAGTVALSRTASVGYSAILGKDMATTQDFANWVPGPRVRPAYLLYVLRAMRPELERLRFGSTHKTIYMPDIRNLVMPLPPLDEQDEIVGHIRKESAVLLEARASVKKAIETLQEYRAALITAAVTGQIEIPEVA